LGGEEISPCASLPREYELQNSFIRGLLRRPSHSPRRPFPRIQIDILDTLGSDGMPMAFNGSHSPDQVNASLALDEPALYNAACGAPARGLFQKPHPTIGSLRRVASCYDEAHCRNVCAIPTSLSAREFDEFVCPFLTKGRRGRRPKLAMHVVSNDILRGLYFGCPCKELPIATDAHGRPEVHYSRVYRMFRRWHAAGCFDVIFANSVFVLNERDLLDTSVVHGATTVAKKSGDNIGFNGHKTSRATRSWPSAVRNCNVPAPFVAAPGNQNESPLLVPALAALTDIARAARIDLRGSIASFDGVYDSKINRKAIRTLGLISDIPENRRGRKKTKRGRKRRLCRDIFRERFRTIKREFAWEDKFRWLRMRFARIRAVHSALKTLAYTMIDLRHFCRG
jgi:hypothetical protein